MMSVDDFAVTICTLVRESFKFFLVLLTHALFDIKYYC